MKATDWPSEDRTTALAHRDRLARRARALARVLVIYGLLLGGALVFTLPFLWMIGTSFKVDREMFTDRITLFPARPVPAEKSPYLDRRYFPEPDDPRYATWAPLLQSLIVENTTCLPTDPTLAPRDWAEVLAPGLFARLRDRLPAQTWSREPAVVEKTLRDHATCDLLAETAEKVYRHLSLAAVRVRSYDLQEADVTAGTPLALFWHLDTPAHAHLEERNTATPRFADLVYDFGPSPAGEIRLSSTIRLPFRADRLHRIQVFLRPDDSWHEVVFYWERNGKRFKAIRPFYLGDFQWTVVTLQEHGIEDAPNKIRLWLPLKEESARAEYEARPDYVKLEMVVRRVGYWGAWWAKIQRNYRGALDYIPFWRYVGTSVFLVILNIIGNILSCSLVAYAFARLRWPGRGLAFAVMLATMMIPPQVTMIPYFLIVKHLGWYNTLKPLWVVSFFGNAFNIFLLRQFMKGIPRDLEDAARIDGCHFLQVYAYVIMPLIKPTLACIAIFTFMGVWNDFMGPLIYLSDQRLYPLSLGLYAFNVQAGANYGMMMAGSLLMTLPVIAVFFFAQKYFIQGVTLTGIKG